MDHFYHQLMRKYVTLFGNIFNEITLKRYNKAHTTEISRIAVPIVYSPKEKYIYALLQDPDKNTQINLTLPAMAFEMTNISYDNTRKQNSLIRNINGTSSTAAASQYMGVPYDIGFALSIYARNNDDAMQIVEQILPIFNPSLTVSVNLLSELGITRDIPVILNSVDQNIEYEGNFETSRYVMWTLNFTMKAFFFGPISTAKIIKTAYANTYLDPALATGYILKVNLGTGSGDYKLEDVVYQGRSIAEASAAGIVVDYSEANTNNKTLRIGGVQGVFEINANIHAASTNAVYRLSSFDVTPIKLVSYKVSVNPLTANIGDDYGFTETTIEYPDTLD